jgi:hypothetical protein
MNLETCAACHVPVRWVITTGGRRLPLDPKPVPDGNIQPVTIDGQHRARVLTGDELPAQGPAWQPHFRSCPSAPEYRRRAALAVKRCGDCRLPMDPWLPENGHNYHVTCGSAWPGEIRANLRRDAA